MAGKTGFYSHLVQNCEQLVKVMTEVDSANGSIVDVESVKLPREDLICPLKEWPMLSEFADGVINHLRIDGSSVKCKMNCVFRTKEG